MKMMRMVGLGMRPGVAVYHCLECDSVAEAPPNEPLPCSNCNASDRPGGNSQGKWDRRFLEMARFVAGWSKDGSTQCGAVIVGPGRDVVSVGYNGFARGVEDTAERYLDRETKYDMVVHAEVNAILFSDRARLQGATLYTWPFSCCSRCAAQVIQAGIKRCVAPPLDPTRLERWQKSVRLAATQFAEAGVELDLIDF